MCRVTTMYCVVYPLCIVENGVLVLATIKQQRFTDYR